MDKEINNNGFDYVDLGLPSGTLWATMNVGASKPSDYGLYFQWGDTQGYTARQVGKTKQFICDDYKWNPSGDGETLTKYANTGDILELEDDAAHVNMGGDWHMPTNEQIQELLDNTTSIWSTLVDVNGRLFISKKDNSKTLFFPAASGAWGGSVHYRGDNGYVWSSVLSANGAADGQFLYLYSGSPFLSSCYRCNGFSVRGVIDGKCGDAK